VQAVVPKSLRMPCRGPELPTSDTVTTGDIATFSILQEAALQTCDARREASISIIDAINAANREEPRPWWRLW
jgi:hypothetical protein